MNKRLHDIARAGRTHGPRQGDEVMKTLSASVGQNVACRARPYELLQPGRLGCGANKKD